MIADTPNGRITYRGEIPPEIHDALLPLLEKYKCLIPDWCHRINVSYWDKSPDGSEGAAADSTCYYEYRWASVRTFPSFFSSKEGQRGEYLAHEMIHVSVNPLYDYACGAIKRLFESDGLKDNKALKDLILMELKDRNESVTTDLQKIVCQLMEAPKSCGHVPDVVAEVKAADLAYKKGLVDRDSEMRAMFLSKKDVWLKTLGTMIDQNTNEDVVKALHIVVDGIREDFNI